MAGIHRNDVRRKLKRKSGRCHVSETERITPQEAREKVQAGKALLICSYTDDVKFARYHLEGAISLSAFKAMEEKLDREREIIFYCN